MVLLGDEAQLKDHFGPFGDSGNIDARWVHGWRWNLVLVHLEVVLALVQDTFTVCTN